MSQGIYECTPAESRQVMRGWRRGDGGGEEHSVGLVEHGRDAVGVACGRALLQSDLIRPFCLQVAVTPLMRVADVLRFSLCWRCICDSRRPLALIPVPSAVTREAGLPLNLQDVWRQARMPQTEHPECRRACQRHLSCMCPPSMIRASDHASIKDSRTPQLPARMSRATSSRRRLECSLPPPRA